MSDYIITCDDEVAGWVGNDVESMRPLVRCRDCEHLQPRDEECGGRNWCKRMSFEVEPNGFCAWGERREPEWVMCKCGESIELGDRESAVCPSCGRTVRE